MSKILLTGILGQDAANMAEYLLDYTDHEIVGLMRHSSNPNFKNISAFKDNPRFRLNFLELSDTASVDGVVQKEQPDYFINFAANSFVGVSWDMPESVFDVNAVGVLRCLEAIKKFCPKCRFYSAGSSEQFGDVDYSPQDIKHPNKARSPYGASKIAAQQLVKVYRESYGLYAVHGILYNHEGKRRSAEFVTRKITQGVAKIAIQIKNKQTISPIELGNLDAKRDWSDSRDFVKGVWLMLNQNNAKPKDYILASGETHSIREFVERAFRVVNIEGIWYNPTPEDPAQEVLFLFEGQSVVENPQTLVKINKTFYRPNEVDLLLGDSTPARTELGWKPEISLDQMIKDMVVTDLKELTETKE